MKTRGRGHPGALEPLFAQSSRGPHSLSVQLVPTQGGSFSSASVLRPLSRVNLSLRKDPALRFDMGANFPARILPQQQSRASRARESPYLRHLPHKKRENYLLSIGTLKELDTEDDALRLESNLRAQLNKIISPIKAPSSVWKEGGSKVDESSAEQQQPFRHQLGGINRSGQHRGLAPFLSLDDEHFSVSPTSSFSGEEELWSGVASHFPPTMNQTIVATPLSDISDFDREITPGQFSTASASSGIYGDWEEEVVAGGSDDYEFIPF